MGCAILRYTDVAGKFEDIASSGYSVERQNKLEVPDLRAGRYLVVPLSSGSKIEQAKYKQLKAGASEESVQNHTDDIQRHGRGQQ